MSLSRETLLELMAFADGELEGAAKDRMERLAAQDGEARRVVEAIRAPGIRTWLGQATEQRAKAADGIADVVMAKLEAGQPAVVRRLPTAGLGRSPRFLAAGVMLGAALAIAASVVFFMRSAQRGEDRAPVASAVVPSLETARPESAHGVEVEEVDSPGHVSIFAIANASAPSSVVVWIEDEPGEK